MRALHDGADGEARVAVAKATPKNAGAISKAVRLAMRAAVVTDEPITPSGALKAQGRPRTPLRPGTAAGIPEASAETASRLAEARR